jgi:3-hydroxyisobutyrate dehydrogenase-like beta-hydroxyacid dehydrogenase
VTRVAVLGVGRMGGAMAGSIARAGFDVAVWNRTPAKADAVAATIGGKAAGSIGEAVDGADVVITSLADDSAVTEVYEGEGGLTATVGDGAVVAEMSTIAPATVRAVGPAVASAGASMIDAPVSGSVLFAERGELTLMVGGDAAALERARPVLDAVGKRIFHLGELGAGATMKLAVNSLLHGLNIALSEALVLVEKAGIERSAAYEVFASGAVAAPFVLYKRAAYENPDDTAVAFSLDLVAKDLDLILALADEVGVRMDQAVVNREVVGAAVASGLGGRDLSAIAVHLRD